MTILLLDLSDLLNDSDSKLMHSLVGRLCLLLLLALDWYAPPALLAPALNALAGHLRSTENFCPSGTYQRAVGRDIAPSPRPGGSRPMPLLCARQLIPTCGTVQRSQAVPPINLVYTFMSVRR
jgi:hypothetical protein